MAIDSTLNTDVLKKIEGHGLVLYDGDCGFCQFWVQFILDRDPKAYFVFAPLQAPWTIALHKLPPSSEFNSVLLYERGIFYEKSTAALRISSHLKWPWKIAKVFLFIPSFVRDIVYDAIAKRRHRISLTNSCRIPTFEERKRFLEQEIH